MSDLLGTSLTNVLAEGVEAGLPVPDTAEPMVTRSVRLPVTLLQRLEAAAAERGIGTTVLMREIIEAGLAEREKEQVFVTLADAINALARVAHRPPAA